MRGPSHPNGPPKQEKDKVSLYLPPDLKDALKMEAARRRMSMNDIIIEALQNRPTLLPSPERKP